MVNLPNLVMLDFPLSFPQNLPLQLCVLVSFRKYKIARSTALAAQFAKGVILEDSKIFMFATCINLFHIV